MTEAERDALVKQLLCGVSLVINSCDVLKAAAAQLESDGKRIASLKAFAHDVLGEWWQSCLDGADLQELGMKHGLIERYDAPADNDCECDEPEPHECYRYSAAMQGVK